VAGTLVWLGSGHNLATASSKRSIEGAQNQGWLILAWGIGVKGEDVCVLSIPKGLSLTENCQDIVYEKSCQDIVKFILWK
jgi:hypothetical protein